LAAGNDRSIAYFSLQIIVNDRIGHKERIKCNEDDKIGDIKILVAFKIGTRAERIRLQLANRVLADNVTLADYEIHDGTQVDMAYE
jgi:ubiquitin-like protein 5